jgi:uncharacterized membrane protein
VVRLVQRVPTFAGLLELAFTEITADGASSPQVARRLLAADDDLGAAVPERLRPSIEQRRAATLAVIQKIAIEGTRSLAQRPDRTGLG